MSADSSLKRIQSVQYPAAHLGHLTEAQESAFTEFKALCQEAGYYHPHSEEKPASHDDETLLRYLRARRFVPKDAFQQFKDTEEWRKENSLEELYENIDVKEYEETRRLYPQWTGRRDKRGIPLYVFEVSHLNSKTVSAYANSTSKLVSSSTKAPPKMLRLFALYENLTRFVMPLCTGVTDRPHPETPISMSNNIVDISGVGLKMFWNLKNHMQDASTLATAHYPETLDRIFIVGAPSFFPTVWGWIKRWFDPITVSKIFILSPSDMKSTLEKYIDPEHIPKKYGGELEFEFGMMPILEPSILEAMKWEGTDTQDSKITIPTGPIKWIPGEDGSMQALAIGTEDGQPRKRIIATIPDGQELFKKIYRDSSKNAPPSEEELANGNDEGGTSTHPVDTGSEEDVPPDSGASTPPAGVLTEPETKALPLHTKSAVEEKSEEVKVKGGATEKEVTADTTNA